MAASGCWNQPENKVDMLKRGKIILYFSQKEEQFALHEDAFHENVQ